MTEQVAIAKDNPYFDFHRVLAAIDLKKNIRQVTPEERSAAKKRNFISIYSHNSEPIHRAYMDYLKKTGESDAQALAAFEFFGKVKNPPMNTPKVDIQFHTLLHRTNS